MNIITIPSSNNPRNQSQKPPPYITLPPVILFVGLYTHDLLDVNVSHIKHPLKTQTTRNKNNINCILRSYITIFKLTL